MVKRVQRIILLIYTICLGACPDLLQFTSQLIHSCGESNGQITQTLDSLVGPASDLLRPRHY